MVDMRPYWPIPGAGHATVKVCDNGFVEKILPDGLGGAWLVELMNGIWQDTWHYIHMPSGVVEDYDLGPKGKTQMVKGKEILWGNYENIGDTIQNQCEIAGKIFGIGKVYGWQRVEFQAMIDCMIVPAGRFENVLQIEYWQYWSNMGPPGGNVSKGAKIWLAKGLGFIKQQWSINGRLTGAEATLQSYTIG